MNILVYLEKFDVRGGIEIFAERHVARLRAEGHEVDVASDIRQEMGGYDEIIVHKCSDVSTLEKFPPEKTVYYVHDHEPICPRSYAYTPLLHNCSRAGGLWPCIFCAPLCRNWKNALSRVLSQGRRKRAMAGFRKLVVISEFMKGRLVANGIPPEKIEVKPPVLDVLNAEARNRRASGTRVCGEPSRAQASAERRGDGEGSASSAPLRLCVENIDLLFVGQLIRGKGVQLLFAAMARMKTPRMLDVVGTGNMEPKLKALAAQLGIAGRVRFNGFQSNPQDWMRAAKCVVVPSFWQEPYGLVAAEAVALGRPVVAFAVGGLPEACGGKATLVPPGDVAALADALELP